MNNETYSRLENEARLKNLGVWAVPGGIQRPWDYRKSRKAGSGANRSGGVVMLNFLCGAHPFTYISLHSTNMNSPAVSSN